MQNLLYSAVLITGLTSILGLILAYKAKKMARTSINISRADPKTHTALSERVNAFTDEIELALFTAKKARDESELTKETLLKHRASANGSIGSQTKKMADLESAIGGIVQHLNQLNQKPELPEHSGDGSMERVEMPR